MLPPPPAGEALRHDLIVNNPTKFMQILLGIESNKSTCCIKIMSPKYKSRSALLIFGGGILECVYSNKKIKVQLFGEEAYGHVLRDVCHPDNSFQAYMLNQDIALATASVFHGETFNSTSSVTVEEHLESAYLWLKKTGKPGCITITDQSTGPVAFTYVVNGVVVGIYSYNHGWVSNDYETALQYAVQTNRPLIAASMLLDNNIEEVMSRTISASGFRSCEKSTQTEGKDKLNLPYHQLFLNQKRIEKTYMPTKFIPKAKVTIEQVKRHLADINPTLDASWAMHFLNPG